LTKAFSLGILSSPCVTTEKQTNLNQRNYLTNLTNRSHPDTTGEHSMAAKKKSTKKPAAKKKKAGAKRKPNAAFMKAMQPSAALGAVIGNSAMPRTEVTKKIWAYIKKHGLQDNKNRRMINADEKLKDVFGGKKQVSMFEMTKLVNKHLK
jgi:chromatin remodeling complex protein RSC6